MKRRKPKPLLEFNLRPERGSSLYFKVRIFRTAGDMRRWVGGCSPLRPWGIGRKYWGIVRGMSTHRFSKKRKSWFRLPFLGEINLVRSAMGSRVVAHEATHAALRFLGRKRLTIWGIGKNGRADKSEERFCDLVGEICRGIYSNAYDAGIISPEK